MSNIRRLLVVLLVVIGAGGVSAAARNRPPAGTAVFTRLEPPKTPYLPLGNRLTSTFYCAGLPGAAEDRGGDLVIANPTDATVSGSITVMATAQPALTFPVSVGAFSSATIDVASMMVDTYVGVVVEVAGGGVAVEQRAMTGRGLSISPCSNDASATWYFADGNTMDGVGYDLILTNPFPDDAVLDMSFITAAGIRSPIGFQNYVVPARSVRVIDLAAVGARDEERLSVSVRSRRGRLVAAKSQSFGGAGRGGSVVALGAPTAGDRWLFADGEKGDGITENIVLFNPTKDPVDVDLVAFALEDAAGQLFQTVTVASQDTAVVDPAMLFEGLPTGRYSLLASTLNIASIVAERVVTRPAGDRVVTSAVIGSRFEATRWWVPSGVPEAAEGALVAFVSFNVPTTITVSTLGPGGVQPVPGLENLAVGGTKTVLIDLTAPEVVDVPLLITSADNTPFVVERRVPRLVGEGRTGALAVPE